MSAIIMMMPFSVREMPGGQAWQAGHLWKFNFGSAVFATVFKLLRGAQFTVICK